MIPAALPPARVFTSDNAAGACPQVVQAVTEAATGCAMAYGNDPLTAATVDLFAEVFEHEVAVIPVGTGSAANGLALAALTPPWGSVLCHKESHVNTDECGAPEFFTNGAKLVPLGGADARLEPEQVRAAAGRMRGDVHSVQPSVLSLSQATEVGTVYPLDVFTELTGITRDAGLRVHLDGARFANALVTLGCSPADLSWRAGVDVLAFGATKNGTMTVDALLVFDQALVPELRFRTKRAGQLTSKMRFQAAQLHAYLSEGLWLRNAAHANALASRLHAGLSTIPGARFPATAESNLLLGRLPQPVIDALKAAGFLFYDNRWGPGGVRFVTTWAHTEADIDALLAVARS